MKTLVAALFLILLGSHSAYALIEGQFYSEHCGQNEVFGDVNPQAIALEGICKGFVLINGEHDLVWKVTLTNGLEVIWSQRDKVHQYANHYILTLLDQHKNKHIFDLYESAEGELLALFNRDSIFFVKMTTFFTYFPLD